MRPTFHPRLVNGPFDDPGLYVPFVLHNRAVLFDLGDIHALSPRDLLKITHVFVSHTHMDHFIGFDHLLRLFLGREKELHLFGPRGILKNVAGKLSGYTWNLVDHYPYRFTLIVTEVDADRLQTIRFPCRNRFQPIDPAVVIPFAGTLLSESAFSVTAVILDHKIDCLGFCLIEKFHINILKVGLDRLGLPVGPWINAFKEKRHAGAAPNTPVEIVFGNGDVRRFPLKALSDQIAHISPGQKIAYITDAIGSEANIDKIVTLADGAHHLFIEAHFREQDRHLATETHHLTAAIAGRIAREARVSHCTPFHFSPRYSGQAPVLIDEVAQAAGPGVTVHLSVRPQL